MKGETPPEDKPNFGMDMTPEIEERMKKAILGTEKGMLRAVGYELAKVSDTAHKCVLFYFNKLKATPQVAQMAWSYVNDMYRTLLCVNYPPNALAVTAIYLAFRESGSEMVPDKPWWQIFETPFEMIVHIAAELLSIYSYPKITSRIISEIMKYYLSRASKSIPLNMSFEPDYDSKVDSPPSSSGLKSSNPSEILIEHLVSLPQFGTKPLEFHHLNINNPEQMLEDESVFSDEEIRREQSIPKNTKKSSKRRSRSRKKSKGSGSSGESDSESGSSQDEDSSEPGNNKNLKKRDSRHEKSSRSHRHRRHSSRHGGNKKHISGKGRRHRSSSEDSEASRKKRKNERKKVKQNEEDKGEAEKKAEGPNDGKPS